MKNARILLATAIFLFSQFSTAKAQTYVTALGVRVDNNLGISLQQYLGNKWTLEAIGHVPFQTKDLGLSLLGEKHHKILVRNLNIYYGVGGHYYWKSASGHDQNLVTENVFGLSGIGGAELSLGRINVAVDYKPELHFSGDQVHPFEWHNAAISVRYILEKRPRNRFPDFKGMVKGRKHRR